jgi:hypothetical protein
MAEVGPVPGVECQTPNLKCATGVVTTALTPVPVVTPRFAIAIRNETGFRLGCPPKPALQKITEFEAT